MTADLELYLRGMYRNRFPCQHIYYQAISDYSCYICGKCSSIVTKTDIALMTSHELKRFMSMFHGR